ncbi:MAG: hypothetical protein QGG48_03955 [Desulfatiglandales bacterium]|nr:hypothetical protein [Desulfatiglandales bacterium]
MRKKKKPKKRKPDHSPPLSTEEETLLNSLLQDIKQIDLDHIKEQIPDPRIAHAIVERLPAEDHDSVDLILAIREAFGQKDIQKVIKKSIFRLKQRGIAVPDLDPHKGPPFQMGKMETDEPRTYLGPIDGVGSRGIFLVLPQIPKGVDVGMGIVNDERGINQFFFGRYSKKQMREVKDLFFENFPHMVQTSLPHAATILEKAHRCNEQSLNDSSSDYLKLRPWILENVSLLDRAAIYDFIPLENVSENPLTNLQIVKVLGHKLMEAWIIDPQEVKPLVERISEVEESRIHLTEVQKVERINDIKGEGVAQLFPDSKRSIIKYRLEEMAYIFFKLDEEEYALLSLSAAASLNKKDSIISVSPFLKTLMERSLDYYLKASGEINEPEDIKADSSPGLIIP